MGFNGILMRINWISMGIWWESFYHNINGIFLWGSHWNLNEARKISGLIAEKTHRTIARGCPLSIFIPARYFSKMAKVSCVPPGPSPMIQLQFRLDGDHKMVIMCSMQHNAQPVKFTYLEVSCNGGTPIVIIHLGFPHDELETPRNWSIYRWFPHCQWWFTSHKWWCSIYGNL